MIDKDALLSDLKVQVHALEDDLRERSEEVAEFGRALRKEWQSARDAKRTAATYESWLEGEVTQAAVAWILGTVFLRFCEDNTLIEMPYLAGPGERLAIAKERHQAFFEVPNNREKTDREWIIEGFAAMSSASPVAAGLFDRAHNPMWRVTPSLDAAKALIAFWRQRGDDGEIIHDFTDDTWNTHFLGDLYQDLSDHAKKTYALLQTPEFVEEFILDLTLEPAVDEFGLDPDPPTSPVALPKGLRLIDPTCGSGHFLLGAFHRLLTKWQQRAPGADRWDLINRVLYSVHGVDKNPFAVAIARFRLLLAAMQAGNVKHLTDTPRFAINVAIADSLIYARGTSRDPKELPDSSENFTYITEDIANYKSVDILRFNTYHVVVGNPPYITVKDSAESDMYRVRYTTCSGAYSQSVPFAECFFNLSKSGNARRQGSGYVGQITANSFMKRIFGKKLIEEFFAQKVELTHVLDTSGAYIPGHGTPTVIVIGRNQPPLATSTIRAVMSLRGEPSQPGEPSEGVVWNAIVKQLPFPGSESEWVSIEDLARERLASYPWNLAGGGASQLREQIERASEARLGARAEIGANAIPRANDEFVVGSGTLRRNNIPEHFRRAMRDGAHLRDWGFAKDVYALWPYDSVRLEPVANEAIAKFLWPWRFKLRKRVVFGQTQLELGLPWTAYSMLFKRRFSSQVIALALVATHNQFVLDRDGGLFSVTAPVIKLLNDASEPDYLSALGLLNSSTACFWLKQVSHNKGNEGYQSGIKTEMWERFYEFTGTKLQEFPLPSELPLKLGQELDSLAHLTAAVEPSAIANRTVPTQDRLDHAHNEHTLLRGRMIALQEELDWETYRLYGLLSSPEDGELWADLDSIPSLNLGERAFEIALARKVAAGEVHTQWFARHESIAITEIPQHWPESYREIVERRIETIEKRRDISLIERPECKRRWQSDLWESSKKEALRNWLMDRCEERDLWFVDDDIGNPRPRPMTINQLTDRMRKDADVVAVARFYAGSDAELTDVVTEIIEAEHVPYLAALRYKDSGLHKRTQWEHAWDLQREEDTASLHLDIPMPRRYVTGDFRKISYWRNRGKLDVPKERFVSYPGASPDGDGSLLLGWAGWDHLEQAHALMMLIEERTTRDGWSADRLTPLISGLAEMLPWVRQWHGEVDPAFGISPADAYAAYLEDQQRRHGLTADDLRNWRPAGNGRGRKPYAKKATS